MTVTEKIINESHIDEVATLIQSQESIINIDREDVRIVLVGKESVLYQAYQEAGSDNGTFMKEFFNELKKKGQMQSCTDILISIGMSQGDPLTMEDMKIITNFFESFDEDIMKVKCGLRNNEEGNRMSLLVICSKSRS